MKIPFQLKIHIHFRGSNVNYIDIKTLHKTDKYTNAGFAIVGLFKKLIYVGAVIFYDKILCSDL